MGYLPTSPQRGGPRSLSVKNIRLSRGEKALPLMVPAPSSPSARRSDRPLADILDDSAFNPLRRKYSPLKQHRDSHNQKDEVHQVNRLRLSDFMAGPPLATVDPTVPAVASNAHDVSLDHQSSSAACFVIQIDAQAWTKDAEEVSSKTLRSSHCYAYVNIPSALSPSPPPQSTDVTTKHKSSKSKVSFDLPSSTKFAVSGVTLPKFEDIRQQDLERIVDLERQLALIESSKIAELEAIRASVQSQKRQIDDEIRAEKTQQTFDDEKLAENRRIIAGLKVENDKIRSQNRDVIMDVRNLRMNNMKLKESLATTTGLHEKLQAYHRYMMKTNESLEKKSRWLERSLQDLQYQVTEVTDFAFCERAWRGVYEQAILDLPSFLCREGENDLSNKVQELSASVTSKPSSDAGCESRVAQRRIQSEATV